MWVGTELPLNPFVTESTEFFQSLEAKKAKSETAQMPNTKTDLG